jgi:hypothetical protein
MIENLAQLADDLRSRGVDVDYEIVFAEDRYMEGLDVGEEFFPLWELVAPENEEALERGDFDAIKSRRAPDWTIVPHHGK